ncbi:flagellar motor switch protein FliG [Tahibacter soli]|uniref:Flagellar motor switch protein FliG n=1 Tax=Tahibacter soli TaxID=2983605 RepID=A0A9X3YI72_9GAMM|nr:flagellar motor switch protein FliG [Tahibacter soli]MDC8012864.1 flagellar motor switch protein FliG [Tahibacter soli]
MSGTQRAAVFLMALGEQEAAEVLRQLGAKEVQKLGSAMATIKSVSREQLDDVMSSFSDAFDSETSLGMGADDYVRKVLVQALGEDKAGGLIDRILVGRNTKGLETLKWMEPRAVADLIRNEHPQIMAIVLAYLDSDQAAEVIKQLPVRVRTDVLLRIATLDGIPPSALNELNEIMERQFTGAQNRGAANVGGVKVAANILNFMDSTNEQQILGSIRDLDGELGNRIQELMFVFDNLAELDDPTIQTLLRDVPGDKLGVALRGADPRVKDKVLRNMSERAATILAEDMEARGPVRLSDVEAAQREILATVRRLADAGTIQLGGKGESFV